MMKHIVMLGVVGLSLAALAMPTKKELRSVQGLVAELMASDLASYKAGTMKAPQVAAKAEGYAREAETEAAKFLFLKGAFGYYMQGEEYGEALRVLNTLTTEVKDVPDKVMAEIVLAKLKRLSKKKGSEIFDYYERLELRMKMSEERAKLEKALKATPKSKEIRRELAVCLAVLGDWPGALEHFAQVGGKEAEAAAAEKAGKRAAAADLWWDAAQGDAEDTFKAHAATLYRQAVAAGGITGLKLTLVKKRLAEVQPAGSTGMSPQRTVASDRRGGGVAAPEKPVETSVANGEAGTPPQRRRDVPVASSTGACDWTIPDDPSALKTFDFDVGCPEKMKFFAMPPGELDAIESLGREFKIDGPFKMTHWFWISQFPVTLEQYESLGFSCREPRIKELAKACEGDSDVAVLAVVNHYQSVRFFETMNKRFGRQLPRGWVFRSPTFAEYNYVLRHCSPTGSCKDKFKWMSYSHDYGRAFLEKKGLPGGLPLAQACLPVAGELKASLQLLMWQNTGDGLDRIVVPGCDLKPWDSKLKGMVVPILRSSAKSENPFWYCEDNSPDVRCIAGGRHLLRMVNSGFPCLCIRIAVGYDYVGEWKRQHGVK